MSAAAEFENVEAELARRHAWNDFYAAHPEYCGPKPSATQQAQCSRRELRRFDAEPTPLTDFGGFDGTAMADLAFATLSTTNRALAAALRDGGSQAVAA